MCATQHVAFVRWNLLDCKCDLNADWRVQALTGLELCWEITGVVIALHGSIGQKSSRTPFPAKGASSCASQDGCCEAAQVVCNVPHAPVGASLLGGEPEREDTRTGRTAKTLRRADEHEARHVIGRDFGTVVRKEYKVDLKMPA